MKIDNIKNYTGGWFIGNFKPSIFNTDKFEVCYKIHLKNEKWPKHYHKIATEYNYLISGKMKIQNKILKKGDIFILYPYETADPTFLEDCELIVVKSPSVKKDKYNVKL